MRWICTHPGTVYAARRRYKWPGQAAVIVSVVHVCKGPIPGPYELDGERVARITAYLFHAGGHEDPARLKANSSLSFIGCDIKGQGFLFDDLDDSATPLSVMRELCEKEERNKERIFPYIGGEEVNTSPAQQARRHVINFSNLPLDGAGQWPDLLEIVQEKVKPNREKQSAEVVKWPWWQFWRLRAEMFATIARLSKVFVNCQVGPHVSFAQIPTGWVPAHTLNVYALSTYSAFGALQSRPHELWARYFGSTMKDDLRYTPSDCFETFPFPEAFESNPALEAAGKAYYEFRADLMVRNNEGLTKTYNRFHDPNETSADILQLRKLHAAMDRAVLDAYGGDLAALTVPPCEFLLDYEEDDEDDEETGKRQRKKPWRYRWPDAFRDEVLALLLELNRQRAERERFTAPAEKPKKTRGKKAAPPTGSELF